MAHNPGLTIVAERSPIRCFSDEEYASDGVVLTDDMATCDILLGIKEVPVAYMIPGKTYFFFSHTKKSRCQLHPTKK
jgi:hypothetical protein